MWPLTAEADIPGHCLSPPAHTLSLGWSHGSPSRRLPRSAYMFPVPRASSGSVACPWHHGQVIPSISGLTLKCQLRLLEFQGQSLVPTKSPCPALSTHNSPLGYTLGKYISSMPTVCISRAPTVCLLFTF